MLTLLIDGREIVESAAALADRVRALDLASAHQIWVGSEERAPSLAALIHEGERGWLMYLRWSGDAGFSTRNPEHAGNDEALEFRLANGQLDRYPAEGCYSAETLRASLVEFLETGERPRGVAWDDEASG